MEQQFADLHIKNHHRVSAIMPNSSEYNIKMLELPCKRNTKRDVSVLLSHLKAINAAVSAPRRPSRRVKSARINMDDFALILGTVETLQ